MSFSNFDNSPVTGSSADRGKERFMNHIEKYLVNKFVIMVHRVWEKLAHRKQPLLMHVSSTVSVFGKLKSCQEALIPNSPSFTLISLTHSICSTQNNHLIKMIKHEKSHFYYRDNVQIIMTWDCQWNKAGKMTCLCKSLSTLLPSGRFPSMVFCVIICIQRLYF